MHNNHSISLSKPKKIDKKPSKKPANKTLVYCTMNDSKCKGLIVFKTDQLLTVQLPTGCVLDMVKTQGRKLYVCHAGMLEFISDGWPTT